MAEQWKKIKGYRNYMVSDKGRIKSLPRKAGNHVTREKILTPRISTDKRNPKKRYYVVALYNNAVRKDIKIHRLVGIHFKPNPLKLPQINHKNKNGLDNRAVNLEWVTNGENSSHGYKGISTLTGAYLDRRDSRWYSRITVHGKQFHLGRFATPQQANKAYRKALTKYGISNRYSL